MNVFEVITGRVIAALKRVIRESERPAEIDFSRVAVDPPREAAHGELSTNAAMVTAKPLGMNPKELAAKLAAILKEDPDIVSAEVAGPGFINLTLTPSFWHGFLAKVLFLGAAYGRVDIGKGEAVNVEYVSTNPTGPIHVGHCRGAVVGDVLANLLEATGHQVTREYYINDAGAQVDVLARSSFLRYREALGEEIGAIPAGLYPGDYLKDVGSALAAEHGRDLLNLPEERWLPLVRVKAVDMMMALIKADLATLNVTHEVFFSERSLTEGEVDRVERAIEFLRAKGDVYVGGIL